MKTKSEVLEGTEFPEWLKHKNYQYAWVVSNKEIKEELFKLITLVREDCEKEKQKEYEQWMELEFKKHREQIQKVFRDPEIVLKMNEMALKIRKSVDEDFIRKDERSKIYKDVREIINRQGGRAMTRLCKSTILRGIKKLEASE